MMLGVAEFEKEYFCGPLYLSDDARMLYEFLGSKPAVTLGTLRKMIFNPIKAWRGAREMSKRLKSKGIEGNMNGDGLTKGGILCISPSGELKCEGRLKEAERCIPTPNPQTSSQV